MKTALRKAALTVTPAVVFVASLAIVLAAYGTPPLSILTAGVTHVAATVAVVVAVTATLLTASWTEGVLDGLAPDRGVEGLEDMLDDAEGPR